MKIQSFLKTSWIDWIQLLTIGLISPFLLFPSMKYIWVISIILLIYVLRKIVKKNFLEKTILDWAIALLLVQVFITCLIIPDFEFSLPKIMGILLGIIVFYSILGVMKSIRLIKFGIFFFIGAGFILSIIGLMGMQWDLSDVNSYFSFEIIIFKILRIVPKIHWNLPGAEDGFNSNAIGGTLILLIPVCLILLITNITKKKDPHIIYKTLWAQVVLFIVTLLICSILFLTLSIESWLALIVSIWILFLPRKWKKRSMMLMVILLVMVFFFKKNWTNTSIEKFKYDLDERSELWLPGIETISSNPIFGIGMNRLRLNPLVGNKHSHAHNQFIHTAAELGIPGLIAYMAILIGTGYMVFQIWHKSEIVWMKKAALGLGGGQLAHLIFGLWDSIPLGAKVGLFFWISLALITSIYNYMIRDKL